MKTINLQSGSALLGLIIIMPFLILITAIYMDLTVTSFRIARGDQLRTHAQLATDGGIDAAMQEINEDETWPGTGGEVELHDDGQLRTTYEIDVTTIDDDSKSLLSTGRTYNPASSTTPTATVSVKVDLQPVTSGEFSVVGGVGGLIMSNSAKILGGDIFINGKVTMSNTSQIGLSTNPVNLSVAHQSCPSPATAAYPTTCNSGQNGMPITITNSAKIYGTVKANNQTNGAGMSDPGLLTPHCLVPAAGVNCVVAEGLPAHDRDAQKAAATTNLTSAAASCSSGTRTWSANTKITDSGNVTISNSCKVTIQGDVWIPGSLDVRNSAELIVSDSLGATKPVIMIDGAVASFRNTSVLRSNVNGTGFQIITYKSDASCSPNCASVTGTDLASSQGDTTIDLQNSASGPNTIFYARWTQVDVGNSGQLGALVGQTVKINNTGTITFGASTGTGSRFWIIDGYRRDF